MSIDEHYAGLYAAWEDGGLAVEAELSVGEGTDETVTVMVIDKREGVEVDIGDGTMNALRPAVTVRLSELADNEIETTSLRGGTLAIGGVTFGIASYHPRPGPAGHPGEVLIILKGRVA
jgi:hypothetical protein